VQRNIKMANKTPYFIQVYCNNAPGELLHPTIFIDMCRSFTYNYSYIRIDTQYDSEYHIKLKNNKNKNPIPTQPLDKIEQFIYSILTKVQNSSSLRGKNDPDLYTFKDHGKKNSYYYFIDISDDIMSTILKEYDIQPMGDYNIKYETKMEYYLVTIDNSLYNDKKELFIPKDQYNIPTNYTTHPYRKCVYTLISKLLKNPQMQEYTWYPINLSLQEICDISWYHREQYEYIPF